MLDQKQLYVKYVLDHDKQKHFTDVGPSQAETRICEIFVGPSQTEMITC